MYKVINVEPGQCKGGVRPWLPTEKFDEVVTAAFTGFDFEGDDEIRVVEDKLDTSWDLR